MPLKPRFCTHCGAALVRRVLGNRPREACPACNTVFYHNPLPVAATVILNEKREVLLVKRRREPYKGMWCLPIGFAELDETIAEAAMRELREEAGIDGRVLRLLDVDSYKSDQYGDLLIVTFEAEKTGGGERAGDDAEALAWFPFEGLPELAFGSNDRAIEKCREIHREEWAIRDSFVRLQQAPSAEMLSDELIALIRDRADVIALLWLADVRSNPTTRSYARADPDYMFERASTALKQFVRWLGGSEADQEVRAFYRALGTRRRADGFELREVLSALMLLRKHIHALARRQGVWQSTIDVYRVLELDRRVVLFFDRAIYHAVRGFSSGRDPSPPGGRCGNGATPEMTAS